MNPPLNLGQVNITFHTNDDDKDDDTMVEIRLYEKMSGSVFVRYDGDLGGHLADHSTLTKTLPFSSGTTVRIGEAYVLSIRIKPNGHDTWKFDCNLDIFFEEDRATRHNPFPNNSLSQNNTFKEFEFTL